MINYKILLDDIEIFDSEKATINTTLSASLNLEVCKAGSLEMTLSPKHEFYNSINTMTSIVKVLKNDVIIFRGRAFNVEEDFIGNRKITFEGDMAFLNDSIIRPYDYSELTVDQKTPAQFLQLMVSEHNSQVGADKYLYVGNVTVSGILKPKNDNYDTAWENIDKHLVDEFGGYLMMRYQNGYSYIDYLSDFTKNSNQTIEFAENLLDLTQTINSDELYTAIIPLGADEDIEEQKYNSDTGEMETVTISKPITIKGVVDPDTGKAVTVDYLINENLKNAYGLIYKVVEWPDCELRIDLYNKAKTHLSEMTTLPKTFEVTALDLSYLSDVDALLIGQNVMIHSDYHNINARYKLEKVKIDILNVECSTYSFGNTVSYVDAQIQKESSLKDSLEAQTRKDKDYLEGKIDELDKKIDENSRQDIAVSYLSSVARVYQPDNLNWAYIKSTDGSLRVNCNSTSSYPTSTTISVIPAERVGYFGIVEVTEESLTFYRSLILKRVVNSSGVIKWYKINDSSLQSEITSAYIFGMFDIDAEKCTLWGVAKSLKDANDEALLTMLAKTKDISNNLLQSFANASGISDLFQKIIAIDAFIKNLNVVNINAGVEPFKFVARTYDANGNYSPQFYISYNGLDVFKVNPSNGQVTVNAQGQWNGQFDTYTLKTSLGDATQSQCSNVSNTIDAIKELISKNISSNTNINSYGSCSGKTIVSISYGDIESSKRKLTKSQSSWQGTKYNHVSLIVYNVSLKVTYSDNSNETFYVRKTDYNAEFNTASSTEKPYPSEKTTYSEVFSLTTEGSPAREFFDGTEFNDLGYEKKDCTISSWGIYDPTREKLYIKSLPTNQPNEANRVWKDSSGYLRIS